MTDAALVTDRSYRFTSAVHWDEFDSMSLLHNARFAVHVERAIIDWYHTTGKRWERNVADNPDQFHAVREFQIHFLSPVTAPGAMRVEIWVERLGATSCVYGFSCTDESGAVEYARGTRAIVKLDPVTRRPAPWTDFFRRAHQQLLRSDA